MKRFNIALSSIIIIVLFLISCTPEIPDSSEHASLTEIPDRRYTIWLAPYLPQGLQDELNWSDSLLRVSAQSEADIVLDIGADHLVSRWIYALVAPFDTIVDEISLPDLKALWQGESLQDFPVEKLALDGSTRGIFEKLWGKPSPSTVSTIPSSDLLATAWEDGQTWSIIPFEELQPQWKVISLDGQSPIQKKFNPDGYPLNVPISMYMDEEILQTFESQSGTDFGGLLLPDSNREADKLTTVVLTGVTALVRATASTMERKGMTYPAIEIGELLRDADILHISNEVPFALNCPSPSANQQNAANLVFCSKPEYIQLLEAIGTDVVELSGDHFRDWGADAMLYTLDLYNQRGWPYYGGGASLEDGMRPALFEHNGNKIAFIGCNGKKLRGYAAAKTGEPGAVMCDMDAMENLVKEVIADGYLPIFTFQHVEYYSYKIDQDLVEDFHRAADAGAMIVSGSQAHQPHAFEFYKTATLHYGLGNLFFDQYYEGFPQRQAFIDRHVFYDGRYISTELFTIMFVDYARSRFMSEEERVDLLQTIFAASGW